MIAVVDYEMGNLRNVQNALEKVGGEVVVTSSPAEVKAARGIVLPGVGAFGKAMENLERLGLAGAIVDEVRAGKPFLGICLGYQLLFDSSEERFDAGLAEGDGSFSREIPGLGIVRGRVRRFPGGMKVPQIGWNQVRLVPECPLFQGVADGAYVYFLHSYFPEPEDSTIVAATTHYGVEFASAVAVDNIWAVQFHPEKSGDVGLTLLSNFARAVRT